MDLRPLLDDVVFIKAEYTAAGVCYGSGEDVYYLLVFLFHGDEIEETLGNIVDVYKRQGQEGVDPDTITGYDREMATHMAVAAAVASDSADAGMGILSAANAMGLDFIEVGPEEYDFAIPVKYLELPHIKAFLEILRSDGFAERIAELGGYDSSGAGEIVYIG